MMAEIIIVYCHATPRFYTKTFAMKNPTMLPTLALEDHIPTAVGFFFTLN
jgi:hypothetical protein